MATVKIGGKEYPLAFTVRSKIELGKIGGGHSYADFINLITKADNDEKAFEAVVKAVGIMHEAYLRRCALDDGKAFDSDDMEVPGINECLDMTQDEWNAVEQAVADAITEGSKPKVETTSKKKK